MAFRELINISCYTTYSGLDYVTWIDRKLMCANKWIDKNNVQNHDYSFVTLFRCELMLWRKRRDKFTSEAKRRWCCILMFIHSESNDDSSISIEMWFFGVFSFVRANSFIHLHQDFYFIQTTRQIHSIPWECWWKSTLLPGESVEFQLNQVHRGNAVRDNDIWKWSKWGEERKTKNWLQTNHQFECGFVRRRDDFICPVWVAITWDMKKKKNKYDGQERNGCSLLRFCAMARNTISILSTGFTYSLKRAK